MAPPICGDQWLRDIRTDLTSLHDFLELIIEPSVLESLHIRIRTKLKWIEGSCPEPEVRDIGSFFTGALYRQNRSMEVRMSSADLVHWNGFGSALCRSMNEVMSAVRAATLR